MGIRVPVFFAGVVFLSTVATSATLTPAEIVAQGEKILRGETMQMAMQMQIHRPEFSRDLSLRSWGVGRTKTLVEILKPVKEEGISSLRVDDGMWNYLPKTDQVVRVPTSMMLQSWMGSDFTNDDLMKLSSIEHDYSHTLVRKEANGSEKHLLIQCTPRPGAPVVWGKILYWAREKDSLPVKEEYYDEGGKLIRVLTLTDFQKMDNRVIPTTLTIRRNDSPEQFTTIRYTQVLYDRRIAESLFDKNGLKAISQRGRNMKSEWYQTPLFDSVLQ